MKVITVMLAVSISLLSSATVQAGMPVGSEFDGQFEELRLTKTDGSGAILKHARIASGTIHSDSEDVGFDAVSRLEYKTGTRAKAGSIWGGILGAGLGLAVSLGTKDTETESNGMFQTETTTIQTWPIYVFTIGGALIGRAIGSGSHTYATLYDESESVGLHTAPGQKLSLGLASAGTDQLPYLTMSVSF